MLDKMHELGKSDEDGACELILYYILYMSVRKRIHTKLYMLIRCPWSMEALLI